MLRILIGNRQKAARSPQLILQNKVLSTLTWNSHRTGPDSFPKFKLGDTDSSEIRNNPFCYPTIPPDKTSDRSRSSVYFQTEKLGNFILISHPSRVLIKSYQISAFITTVPHMHSPLLHKSQPAIGGRHLRNRFSFLFYWVFTYCCTLT